MVARVVDYIRQRAQDLGANGCTGVPEFYRDCCLEHDVYYITGRDLDGVTRITRAEADRRFRQCIQNASWLGTLSPVAWWRWVAVRLFGGLAWRHGP